MGFFLMFLIYAVLFVLSDLLTPKPDIEDAKPAGQGDFQFPTATEERQLPLLWGTRRIAGPNVVWYGDFVKEAITERVRTGLFSKENVVVGWRYSLGVQQALCQGPATALLRVWIGDEEVVAGTFTHEDTFEIDEPELFGGEDVGGTGGVVGTLQFWSGTDDQTTSPYLEDFQKEPPDTGDTPAYRDCCYVAPFEDPTYLGNSPSIKPWKFEIRRCPNQLGLTGGREIVNDGDANPAAVIFEVLTNEEWGHGIIDAEVDDAALITVGNTLFDEGNGFSMVLDRVEDLDALVRRIEEQVDGIVFLDPLSGKWTMRLIRDDYDPELIPEIDDSNILDVQGFTQGTWEGTKNYVRLQYNDRAKDYVGTFAPAIDGANVRIVGKRTTALIRHPGVVDGGLAQSLAWRELRTLAIPLSTCDVVVNRTLYGVLPGDVVAYTNERQGITRRPMRVKSANYGELLEGRITLSLAQDVFRAAAGSVAPSPQSGWVPPEDELVAYPVDQQLAFEAPRGLTLRDPDSASPITDKVYAAARRQGPEISFLMVERHSSGTPAGAFTEFGQVYQFMRIGELAADLPVGSTYPLTSLTLDATPDTQAAIETAFPDITNLADLGIELLTLCVIGDGASQEFILVSSAQNSGADVQLNNVYRGVLDPGQQAHVAGDPVHLLFVGGGISDSTINPGQNVHVKLLPRGTGATLDEGDATLIAFTMENRVRRPYPPSEMSLNGVRFDPTVSLEGGAGVGENIGIDLTFKRRDFRTVDEITALLTDAASLDPSYPTANSTFHEVDVYDVSGAPTLLFTQNLGSGTSGSIRRLDILEATDGVLPTDLRFDLRSSHFFDTVAFDSRYVLAFPFEVSSALTGLHEFGALDTNDVGASFTVDAGASDHVFTLSSAFTLGDVEYRVNGGAWTSLIAAGLTTGTILEALLNNGDTIQIRHLSTDVGAQKLITMTDGAPAAFGVLYV